MGERFTVEKNWKNSTREDARILIESMRDLAGALSKDGYMHIADVLAKDGLQKALKAVEKAKENVPGEKPKLYRTGVRPYDYNGYMVLRDKHAALGLLKRAPKSLPLDLYSPEPVAWIGCQNAGLVLENSEAVMEFVRKNYTLLRSLSWNAAALAVTRFARGEDTSEILDECILKCLKEGIRAVARSSISLTDVDQLFGFAVVSFLSSEGARLRIVDLDELKISKAYRPGEVASLLLKLAPKVKWVGDLIEILGKCGKEQLRALAKLKPELAVLIP